MRKLFWGSIPFVLLYTLFWLHFFHVTPFQKSKNAFPYFQPIPITSTSPRISWEKKQEEVLSEATVVPGSFNLQLLPRKQAFNLSCEFTAASAIIHYFTADDSFAVKNEVSAEKTLMEKVGVSQNPNLGIRMGDIMEGDLTSLYQNLNNRFGGTDYYGIHASPFIDLFSEYGLLAKPLPKEDNIISSIQNAVSSGHLVMAWIRIGYGQAVDIALSHGVIPLVRGEHTVVIHGYDEKGVIVMDPGSAAKRYIKYEDLADASKAFPLPFLEVYPVSLITTEDVYNKDLDKIIGLPREKLTISVENGSGKTGRGSLFADILRDFGYHVISLKNADNFDYENVTITMKKSMWDYRRLLEKDLRLASYTIATISSNVSEEATSDATIIIGK